ncbi:MAG: hypothetical protein JNK93_19130 [Planctomycetia bacterium]|nr:hypothetical protein [Planctomycetia bacterium]
MSRRSLLALLPTIVLFATGCGGDGTSRVSGTVKFAGQPVKAGKIYFTPDGAKGNSGPTGYAEIIDGAYDTSAAGGRGAGKGAMIVAIEGRDPSQAGKTEKGDTSGEVTVKTLFPRYETTADLPGGATTKDFEVPADAAKPKPNAGNFVVP